MIRKLYLIGGVLALFLAAIGLIALNIDSTSQPAVIDSESILGDDLSLIEFRTQSSSTTTPASTQAIAIQGSSSSFAQSSQSKLISQLNGLNTAYFGTTYQRVDTHITVDKLVYTAGEYLFISVSGNDPFTKLPYYRNFDNIDQSNNVFLVDIQDEFGRVVAFTVGYYVGPGGFAQLQIPIDAFTSTYTVRVYGPSYVSSYKQVRVLGDRDYFTDFPVYGSTPNGQYQPGDLVQVDFDLPYGYGYQGLQVYAYLYVNFENNQNVSNSTSVIASQTSDTKSYILFTIPAATAISQNFIYINFTFNNGEYDYWASLIIPLLIQPKTLQAFLWTDSFAPIVDGTIQTFYLYAYYGTPENFPNSQAFQFPANAASINVLKNTTDVKSGKLKTAISVRPNVVGGVDMTGLVTFTQTSNKTDLYYFQIVSGSGKKGTVASANYNVKFYSYFTYLYTRTSEPEIYFTLQSNKISAQENVTLDIYTNSYVNSSTVFLLLIKQKEQIVYNKFYTFATAADNSKKHTLRPAVKANSSTPVPLQLTIPPSVLPVSPGNYAVLLYRVTSAWYNYDYLTNNNQLVNNLQQVNKVNSWLDLRGVITFYRKFSTSQLKFAFSTDLKLYYPGDLVSYQIQVQDTNNKAVTEDIYLNIAVTDAHSYDGLPSGTVANPTLSYKFYVENEILFPTYDLSIIQQFQAGTLNSTVNNAVYASQVYDFTFAEFQGYRYIQLFANHTALPEYVQIAQRYFGCSFRSRDPYIYEAFYAPTIMISGGQTVYKSVPFSSYAYVFNNIFLALSTRKQNNPGFLYYNYYNTGNFGNNDINGESQSHWWYPSYDFYNQNDFSQTVYFGSVLLAPKGLLKGKFVTNDNNTAYQVYIEGFSLSGDQGQLLINSAIQASNANRPAPFSISYPPANTFALQGDDITLFYNFTNNLNVQLNWRTTLQGCEESLSYTYPDQSGILLAASAAPPSRLTQVGIEFVANYLEQASCDLTIGLEVYSLDGTLDIPVTEIQQSFSVQRNGIYVSQYDAGLMGSFLTNGVSQIETMNLTLLFPDTTKERLQDDFYFELDAFYDSYQQYYWTVGYQIYGFIESYQANYESNTPFELGIAYTFEDFLYAAYICNQAYNLQAAGYDLPDTQSTYVNCFNSAYGAFSNYWNAAHGAYQSTTTGPVDDLLSAMALNLLGKSDMQIIDNFVISNLTAFLWKGRTNAKTGVYYNPSNVNSIPPQTTPIEQLLVRAVVLLGLSAGPAIGEANYNIIEADLQQLYLYAFNFTLGCGSAEQLYFIGLTILALNNHGRYNNVTYLSEFFQNYLDAQGQFPVNETTQSVFLTNPFERFAEMQGLGTYILALGQNPWGANQAWQGLQWFQKQYTFGGHIATLFGNMAVIQVIAMGYDNIPWHDDYEFAILIHDTLNGQTHPWIDFEYNQNEFQGFTVDYVQNNWTPATWQTANGQIFGEYSGPDTSDYFQYIFFSVYVDYHNSIVNGNSPLKLTLTAPQSRFTIGSQANLWQPATYTIGITNTDTDNNYKSVEIGFRIPSCLYFDPTIPQPGINPNVISLWNGGQVDPVYGVLYFNVLYLLASQTTTFYFILTQTAVGSCAQRQVHAQLASDDFTLIYAFNPSGV